MGGDTEGSNLGLRRLFRDLNSNAKHDAAGTNKATAMPWAKGPLFAHDNDERCDTVQNSAGTTMYVTGTILVTAKQSQNNLDVVLRPLATEAVYKAVAMASNV